MEKTRRRQVPAFGEWNYCYYYDEPPAAVALAVAAECYQPEPEACSDVWFRYSPPPRKPTPKKTRRAEQGDVARREKVERRGSRALDAAGDGMPRAAAKAGSRVVRPVDEDLYQVPPPEFASRRPRRKRSLLMGCLGLNSCVA
ncbi:hypothetical protein D1007_18618 [Hordeum vulgare]|uniref:Uncharacterized protein n=1 Tax=Hordeum vulgare subsp. vulgare TaxID=112509 RepID=A0A8I6Y3F4_HORVV|nr:uncharacterized protein LOC123446960 [Hordeum vulgare subsp. vulgare]KAE8805378.1 hypothetical protein D1007_18618 [Hordeum vulgare]KAI4992994.1 hypothetical protein ZWY2020_007307 [Hordeum vulgare]